MATNNLKVDEIRAQLAKRGLSTAGIKLVLVRRLEDALRDESGKSADSEGDIRSSRKRQRNSDVKGADPEVPRKIKAIDELRSMNVKQLREEASIRGVSAAGTKAQLLERLCADDDSVSSDNDEAEKESKRKNADSHATLEMKAIDELQKMNIKQLREEAAKRGISAAGTRKELLERLFSDNDNVSNDKDQAKEESKKEHADSHSTLKTKTIDELQKMNVKQLREEAAKRGVSAAGTKKELLERLCSDNDNVSNDKDQVSSTEEEKEEKIVTATKKGSAVLDKWLPDHIKSQYHVLQVVRFLGDEIYDAMLNQTNVGENNNKFFVIQVLESNDGGKFMVYYRWGRVGVKGQDKLNGPYTSQQAAVSEFEKKFYDKTKNHWSNRNEFVSCPKSYTWLEMDYSETKNESATGTSRVKAGSTYCKVHLSYLQYEYDEATDDGNRLCLVLNLEGYDVLKRIADVIGQADKKTLEQLSGEFYTVIPHDFGFRKTSEFSRFSHDPWEASSMGDAFDSYFVGRVVFLICQRDKLLNGAINLYDDRYTAFCTCLSVLEVPQYWSLVEALGEIEVAMKLIEDDTDMEDPLYSHYRRLHCELLPLEAHSDEFSMVEKYTKNTHAKTHSSYDVKIIQIFKVSREGEAERFEKQFSRTKNKMLLWHGSRLTNWTGILSQGLRIAPPEAPVTGYMFGKGVYFADMFSKSANYCCVTKASTAGVLLLLPWETWQKLLTANYDADKLPAGKLSTKGVGATAPDLSEALTLEDGVVVPLGTPKEQPGPKGSLLYNEYIVYNVEQIRMRYLVQVYFKYKSS
ncbi:Poly [ADP-ribose] polymerase 2 [Sesamum angolense]|uniref:Poly [ADP-ribose] polymerase n=1 Tax=Sesamum angolense TaxID=2727404 RepID=A0AAE2C2Y0_9LAMI|nr:Poly [ADP-ribose] polymerase 2 [Sesamum angolense]